MIIEVTQADIDKGETHCGYNCPIALAARRATNSIYVFVTGNGLRVNTLEAALPHAALEFISRFDLGRPVQPFSFEVGANN